MKKVILTALCSISLMSFAQKKPQVNKTEFSQEALSQKIMSQDGKKTSVADVFQKHKGKILIIDFWASWCQDCITALPSAKMLQENNPELDFVYFSLDRSHAQWKKGLDKYQITNQENYWFDSGWKNNFNNYIDLDWVPRFMVIDQTGNIAKYYAIHPTDPDIQKTIYSLLRKEKK